MAKKEKYYLKDNLPIYAYLPEAAINGTKFLPMVLDLNCTTGNPEAEVKTNGWGQIIDQENFVLIAPTYNDYATYSECDYLKWVINDAISRYPVDISQIYSVGFSNGGAVSVALASSFPKLLAGIAAMGWMVEPRQITDLTIPFVVIQGTKEETSRNFHGQMMVMRDERKALAYLMATNQLNAPAPNYGKEPYWGYPADKKEVLVPDYYDYDPYGNDRRHQTKKRWTISHYYKDGFKHPFAELVLVEGAPHIPHDYNAQVAWNFLKHFRRTMNGKIIEK